MGVFRSANQFLNFRRSQSFGESGPFNATILSTEFICNGDLDQQLTDWVKDNPSKHLHLYRLDVFTLFNQMVASPSTFSLTNVTGVSQGVIGLNPDTYLFWDDIHPTTKGFNVVALTAAKLLDSKKCWGYVWPYPLAESERSCAVR